MSPWNHDGTWPCTGKHCYSGVGQIEPVGGFLSMLSEDLRDKNVARCVEGKTQPPPLPPVAPACPAVVVRFEVIAEQLIREPEKVAKDIEARVRADVRKSGDLAVFTHSLNPVRKLGTILMPPVRAFKNDTFVELKLRLCRVLHLTFSKLDRLPGSQRTANPHATAAGAHIRCVVGGLGRFCANLRPLFLGCARPKFGD